MFLVCFVGLLFCGRGRHGLSFPRDRGMLPRVRLEKGRLLGGWDKDVQCVLMWGSIFEPDILRRHLHLNCRRRRNHLEKCVGGCPHPSLRGVASLLGEKAFCVTGGKGLLYVCEKKKFESRHIIIFSQFSHKNSGHHLMPKKG